MIIIFINWNWSKLYYLNSYQEIVRKTPRWTLHTEVTTRCPSVNIHMYVLNLFHLLLYHIRAFGNVIFSPDRHSGVVIYWKSPQGGRARRTVCGICPCMNKISLRIRFLNYLRIRIKKGTVWLYTFNQNGRIWYTRSTGALNTLNRSIYVFNYSKVSPNLSVILVLTARIGKLMI